MQVQSVNVSKLQKHIQKCQLCRFFHLSLTRRDIDKRKELKIFRLLFTNVRV